MFLAENWLGGGGGGGNGGVLAERNNGPWEC